MGDNIKQIDSTRLISRRKLLGYALAGVGAKVGHSLLAPRNGMGGNNDGWIRMPDHKNAGLYVPWTCAFERDHVPPLDPVAEELFLEARTLQTSKPYLTEAEEIRIFNLYKEAADLNHWRAMNNLAECYIKGTGTRASITTTNDIYDRMMEMGIPIGFYDKYLLVKRGRGVMPDAALASQLLYKAADLGSPLAQNDLGRYYMYPEQRDKQGLRYFICSLRQGNGQAGREIGFYLLLMEENYLMAAEYYWRAAALGNKDAIMDLFEAFGKSSYSNGPRSSLGFASDTELQQRFANRMAAHRNNPQITFPNLLEEEPIPHNPTMSRRRSRAMPSNLRLDDGSWPDEVYPELAPGYVFPRY